MNPTTDGASIWRCCACRSTTATTPGRSINGSRITESDHPGVDRQYSTGISARADYTGLAPGVLTAIATYADTTVNYGFDGDWGNPVFWAPYTYDYTEYQVRYRSTRSLEIRLGDTREHGLSWLFGAYEFQLRESLSDTSNGVYVDPFDASQNSTSLSVVQSQYHALNSALYGQLDGDLGARARWSLGLRGERRTTHYDDTTTNLDAPTVSNVFDPEDNLWGGHASLDYTMAKGRQIYALIARGYKAGGFNLSQGLPANQILFGPEDDVNYEVGYKSQAPDGSLRTDTSLFYMARHAPQLLTGEQLKPGDPNTFIFYTGNAQSGYNYGLESSVAWRASSKLEFGASLGLLQTLYRGFVQNGMLFPNRALPNAPAWQAAINATWRDPRGPFARLDVTGMGSYFYDLPPNWTRSNPYGLLNAKLGWQTGRYEIYLMGQESTQQGLHRARLLFRRPAAELSEHALHSIGPAPQLGGARHGQLLAAVGTANPDPDACSASMSLPRVRWKWRESMPGGGPREQCALATSRPRGAPQPAQCRTR